MRRRLARQEGQSPQGNASLPGAMYGRIQRMTTSGSQYADDGHQYDADDDAAGTDADRNDDDDTAYHSPPFLNHQVDTLACHCDTHHRESAQNHDE